VISFHYQFYPHSSLTSLRLPVTTMRQPCRPFRRLSIPRYGLLLKDPIILCPFLTTSSRIANLGVVEHLVPYERPYKCPATCGVVYGDHDRKVFSHLQTLEGNTGQGHNISITWQFERSNCASSLLYLHDAGYAEISNRIFTTHHRLLSVLSHNTRGPTDPLVALRGTDRPLTS
jgi:hypothetical protein